MATKSKVKALPLEMYVTTMPVYIKYGCYNYIVNRHNVYNYTSCLIHYKYISLTLLNIELTQC